MRKINTLSAVIGGYICGSIEHFDLNNERVTLLAWLNESCPEDKYRMPFGDIITFTKDGVFSDKNIPVTEDSDWMSKYPSFSILDVYFSQDEVDGLSIRIRFRY